MVEPKEFIAARDCPRDCPFLDRIASGQSMRFCSFAVYADLIEPGRHTRTEVNKDGTINYNIPPHCNVYDKYREFPKIIKETKRRYESHLIQLRLHHNEPDLSVTAHKHPVIVSHHRNE